MVARWSVPGSVHERHFADQLAGRTTYLIAWRGEEPLGSAVLQWSGCVGNNARQAHPEVVELNHLQVREGWRGQGVGSRLISAAEKMVTEAGKHAIAVGVGDDNSDAERLYVRLGYLPTSIWDVCDYDWIDDAGEVHNEVERSQLLVKSL